MAQNNERSVKRDASYSRSAKRDASYSRSAKRDASYNNHSASFYKSVSRSRSRGEHYSPLRANKSSVSPHERQLNTRSMERPAVVNSSPPKAVIPNRSSPLRSKSHSKSPLRSPPKIDQHHEDNRQRMMKSQERIAALLGYGGNSGRGGTSNQNHSIQQLLESKRSAGGLGSNYKNLVDRSHSNSKSPHLNRDLYQQSEPQPTTQFATSMVR